MSKSLKKKGLSRKNVIISCIIFFLAYNIVWYIGAFHQYFMWHLDMVQQPDNREGDIVDKEGYCLALHYPIYLDWKSGNLSVSSPLEEFGEVHESDGKSLYVSSSGLIIWLKHFSQGIKEIGVRLEQEGVTRYIYLVDSETARYADDQPYVDAGKEEIEKLFRKAEEQWNLEMPWKN